MKRLLEERRAELALVFVVQATSSVELFPADQKLPVAGARKERDEDADSENRNSIKVCISHYFHFRYRGVCDKGSGTLSSDVQVCACIITNICPHNFVNSDIGAMILLERQYHKWHIPLFSSSAELVRPL